MSGIRIHIDRQVVKYHTPEEDISTDGAEVVGFDTFEDQALRICQHIRRILTTIVRPTPVLYGLLHWNADTSLSELDEAILHKQVVNEDFDEALLVQPATLACRNCNSEFRALTVDTGQVIFSKTLAERVRNHAMIRVCPACNEPWAVWVVEII